jgi:hypothetical protein
MKRLVLVAAMLFFGIFMTQQTANAQSVRFGVNLGFQPNGFQFNVGAGFNQRYVAAGQAWVNEPYVYWRRVPDVTTGKVHLVPQVGYTRRLVVLYLDTWTSTYFYRDSMGNVVPWPLLPRW